MSTLELANSIALQLRGFLTGSCAFKCQHEQSDVDVCVRAEQYDDALALCHSAGRVERKPEKPDYPATIFAAPGKPDLNLILLSEPDFYYWAFATSVCETMCSWADSVRLRLHKSARTAVFESLRDAARLANPNPTHFLIDSPASYYLKLSPPKYAQHERYAS